jgi:hypothetical protein
MFLTEIRFEKLERSSQAEGIEICVDWIIQCISKYLRNEGGL